MFPVMSVGIGGWDNEKRIIKKERRSLWPIWDGIRKKGDHSKFSATELGMRLGCMDLEERKKRCGSNFHLIVT